MTSEIDKLKHFHIEDYSGIYFTDELNAGEEFLYTTIGIKDDKEVTFLCKYIKNKHIEACPNCVFNNYFCHGLLCNIVVLKVCSCLRGIRLEDVTVELEKEAYEEMRHN